MNTHTKTLSTSVSADLARHFKAAASSEDVPPGRLLRRLIAEHVAKYLIEERGDSFRLTIGSEQIPLDAQKLALALAGEAIAYFPNQEEDSK